MIPISRINSDQTTDADSLVSELEERQLRADDPVILPYPPAAGVTVSKFEEMRDRNEKRSTRTLGN